MAMYFRASNLGRDGEWRQEAPIHKLIEVEQLLNNTGRMWQQKPMSIDSKKQVKKCYVYPYPHSERQLQEDKILFTPFALVKLVFILHKGAERGFIEITEKSLTLLESDIYYCHNKHKSVYKVTCPLREGYVLHCTKCGQPMSLIQEALLPDLRGMIAEPLKKGDKCSISHQPHP